MIVDLARPFFIFISLVLVVSRDGRDSRKSPGPGERSCRLAEFREEGGGGALMLFERRA